MAVLLEIATEEPSSSPATVSEPFSSPSCFPIGGAVRESRRMPKWCSPGAPGRRQLRRGLHGLAIWDHVACEVLRQSSHHPREGIERAHANRTQDAC